MKNNIKYNIVRFSTIFLSVFIALFAFASPAQAIYNGVLYYSPFPPVGIFETGFRFSCSGTLIAPSLVLTAAHCLSYGDPQIFYILNEHGPNYGYLTNGHQTLDGLPPPDDILSSDEAAEDVAVLELASPVPSSVAVPVPLGDAFSTIKLAIGFGETCGIGCNDSNTGQRGQTYNSNSSYLTYYFCNGDSGGALLDSLGRIVGVISVGTCGGEIRGPGRNWYGHPLNYVSDAGFSYLNLKVLIAINGGRPYCAASIYPTSGNLSTEFLSTLQVAGLGASCSYKLDDQDFKPMASCAQSSSPEFLGSAIKPAQHSLVFKIQNSAGSYPCPTNSFRVRPIVGKPDLTISPQNANVSPGGSLTFTIATLDGINGTPVYNWTATLNTP